MCCSCLWNAVWGWVCWVCVILWQADRKWRKKKKNPPKKKKKFEGSGRNRYKRAWSKSNIKLTKHNRNAEIQNNLPSQATPGFHLPWLPQASMVSWEAGKPRKAVKFRFQSKTLIIPRNGCKFSIYKSMWLLVPLELKATNVQKKTRCHQQGSWGMRGTRAKPQASQLLPQTSRLKDRQIMFWVSLRNLDEWHSKCFTCSQLQLLRMFLIANKNSPKPRLYSHNVKFSSLFYF